jgi:imidazolonepropionase-like amidohydrolase
VRLWAVRILNSEGSGLLSWYVCGLDWIAAQRDPSDPALPMFEAHLASFRLAVAMGVKIGSGCDAFSDPVTAFGPYNLREIELLQQAGLSALDALRAATASNAELPGLDADVGALEPGRLADVLVVKGDLTASVSPLADPDNLSMVMQGGLKLPRLKDCAPRQP